MRTKDYLLGSLKKFQKSLSSKRQPCLLFGSGLNGLAGFRMRFKKANLEYKGENHGYL